jgi:hypothetical protein
VCVCVCVCVSECVCVCVSMYVCVCVSVCGWECEGQRFCSCAASHTSAGASDSTIKVWDMRKFYCTHNLRGSQGVIRYESVLGWPLIHSHRLHPARSSSGTHCSQLTRSQRRALPAGAQEVPRVRGGRGWKDPRLGSGGQQVRARKLLCSSLVCQTPKHTWSFKALALSSALMFSGSSMCSRGTPLSCAACNSQPTAPHYSGMCASLCFASL